MLYKDEVPVLLTGTFGCLCHMEVGRTLVLSPSTYKDEALHLHM
jgi:hypothetical protein